jgi:hypothetical protein
MNIDYKRLLLEERSTTAPLGCLMAKVDNSNSQKILAFSKKIISDDILYDKNGEFGREMTPHVTIKYGFDPDLTELDIRKIIKGIKPFSMRILKLSLFNASPNPFHHNSEYDVVKFDVEASDLKKMRRLCDQYPNRDTFPDYHPHLTLAYVLKDTFKPTNKDITMSVRVNQIYYSPAVGEKSDFNL